MSQEDVERFLRSVDAWSRGDRDAWLADIPPEWEFYATGLFPGLKAVYHGRSGAAELWDGMREPWEQFEISVQRVEDLGEKLLCLVTFEVRGRDGLEISRQWAYVGTPTRTDNFASWEEALSSVGLSG